MTNLSRPAPSQRRPHRIRDIRSIAIYLFFGVILTYLTAWACDRWMPEGKPEISHGAPLGVSDAWDAELLVSNGLVNTNLVTKGTGHRMRATSFPLLWSELQRRLVWTDEIRTHYLNGDKEKPPISGSYTSVQLIEYAAGWPLLAVHSQMTNFEFLEIMQIPRLTTRFLQGTQEHTRLLELEAREQRDTESLRELGFIKVPFALRETGKRQANPIILSVHPLWPGFIVNTLFWSSVLFALINTPRWIVKAIRNHRRARRGVCLRCGYTLAGLTQCPECGTIVRVPAPRVSESQA